MANTYPLIVSETGNIAIQQGATFDSLVSDYSTLVSSMMSAI